MPLKEAALALGEVDQVARLAGAGNTLVFDDAGPAGSTTPTSAAWSTRCGRRRRRVDRAGDVLGAGATARSTLVSLAQLGRARGDRRGAYAGEGRTPLQPLAERAAA